MSIRDEALAAWQGKADTWADEAAQHLANGVLWNEAKNAPAVAAKDLTEVHRDFDNRLVVFTGPADDGVSLAVRGEGEREVLLVADEDGWTFKSGPLDTLADLGRVLEGQQ